MNIFIYLFFFKNISNSGTVKFFDEVKSLKREIKKLRDDGVNIIIGLGHSGIEVDQIIAKEVEDIDLIVGGHSHTFLYSGKRLKYCDKLMNKPIHYNYKLFMTYGT